MTEQPKPKKRKVKRWSKDFHTEAYHFFESSDPIIRLSTDLKEASRFIGRREARYLVDSYYQFQELRKACDNRIDAAQKLEEPVNVLRWSTSNARRIEDDIKGVLGSFADEYMMGEWLQSLVGIGPVISAGLLSMFDVRERIVSHCDSCKSKAQDKMNGKGQRNFRPIHRNGDLWEYRCTGKKCETKREVKIENHKITEVKNGDITKTFLIPSTAGSWWRFAGLDPTLEWKKGTERPWSATAKTLCFKIGDCFIKFQNKEGSFYGPLYAKRRQYEDERDERGYNREVALKQAERVGKNTVAYQSYSKGKLPDAHRLARARRWTVKIFLSHVHDRFYREYYGEAPRIPYAFDKLPNEGHRHYIEPPEYKPGGGKTIRELLDG